MIKIPEGFYLTKGMRDLIEFFNDLEKKLEYPNSEGYSDQKRVLLNAETELIKWGKI